MAGDVKVAKVCSGSFAFEAAVFLGEAARSVFFGEEARSVLACFREEGDVGSGLGLLVEEEDVGFVAALEESIKTATIILEKKRSD